jgi:hypothetical protein
MRISAAIAATAILAITAGAAHADVLKYRANLNGAAEAPATTSAGKGVINAIFDTDTAELDYTVTYSGLSGPATAADLQGVDGSVVAAAANAAAPISGSVKLNQAQVHALNTGGLYFNVQTSANPKGEIRGQMRRDY